MYEYKIDHISKEKAGKKVTGDMMESIDFITVHNNGNKSSSSQNERDWLENPNNIDNWANYTIVVDEQEAIECNDLNAQCFHAGDGEFGVGNTTSASVEICELNHELSKKNGIDVIARLMIKLNLGIDRVVPHFEWSWKDCPRLILENWDDFISEVEARYKEIKIEMDKNECSDWAIEAQKWVIEKGISDGTRPFKSVTREELWTMLYRYDNLIK
jgi:N-acetylmuramoyl-L-alanine amidase